MRAYPVPVQLNSEERIIGSILTLRQITYLAVALALGGAAGMGASLLPVFFRVLLAAAGLSLGAALAFVSIAGMGLDTYLLRLFRWRFSRRALVLKGDNQWVG